MPAVTKSETRLADKLNSLADNPNTAPNIVETVRTRIHEEEEGLEEAFATFRTLCPDHSEEIDLMRAAIHNREELAVSLETFILRWREARRQMIDLGNRAISAEAKLQAVKEMLA